jgi:hypothetical protein
MNKGCPEFVFSGHPFFKLLKHLSCERKDVKFPKENLLF